MRGIGLLAGAALALQIAAAGVEDYVVERVRVFEDGNGGHILREVRGFAWNAAREIAWTGHNTGDTTLCGQVDGELADPENARFGGVHVIPPRSAVVLATVETADPDALALAQRLWPATQEGDCTPYQ